MENENKFTKFTTFEIEGYAPYGTEFGITILSSVPITNEMFHQHFKETCQNHTDDFIKNEESLIGTCEYVEFMVRKLIDDRLIYSIPTSRGYLSFSSAIFNENTKNDWIEMIGELEYNKLSTENSRSFPTNLD